MRSSRRTTENLVFLALFCALSYVTMLVFPLKVSFLTLDFKDVMIVVASMTLGPVYGIVAALIVAFLEFITVSGTGFYGLLMNFVSSAALAGVAGFLYSRKKTFARAVLSLAVAVVTTGVLMLGMNLLITPLYMGVSRKDVLPMLLPTLLPFNLIKGTLNASLVILLYKPISDVLRHFRKEESVRPAKKMPFWVALAVGGAVLALALLFLFLVFGGQIALA